MWIEAEDGSFVNLDHKRMIIVQDKLEDDGNVAAVTIVADDVAESSQRVVLRVFSASSHLPLTEARAAADTFMQGIRQAMTDKGAFIRPASRSTAPGTVVSPSGRKGTLRERE